ncbi:unnamed protein product, partial [Symbiodinium microadriaticum]
NVRAAKAHSVSGLIEKGLPALHLEFDGGMACDIENVHRGSTMEIVCGVRDTIEDIIEDRTCHYIFKITSRALCSVPGFAPPKRKVATIQCSSGEGGQGSDEMVTDGETYPTYRSNEHRHHTGDDSPGYFQDTSDYSSLTSGEETEVAVAPNSVDTSEEHLDIIDKETIEQLVKEGVAEQQAEDDVIEGGGNAEQNNEF